MPQLSYQTSTNERAWQQAAPGFCNLVFSY